VRDFADRCDTRGKAIWATLLTKHEKLTMDSPLDTETAMTLTREFGTALGRLLGGGNDPRTGGVREPKKHGPSGKLSAAAIPEPDDDRQGLNAVGKSNSDLQAK
jgi:hypothetical protein